MVDRTNSERPEALAARQREHRLQERVKPKQPAPPNTDPWLIADEALDLLDRAERRLRHLRLPADELEEIGELLRRLAWGPEEV